MSLTPEQLDGLDSQSQSKAKSNRRNSKKKVEVNQASPLATNMVDDAIALAENDADVFVGTYAQTFTSAVKRKMGAFYSGMSIYVEASLDRHQLPSTSEPKLLAGSAIEQDDPTDQELYNVFGGVYSK